MQVKTVKDEDPGKSLSFTCGQKLFLKPSEDGLD